MIAAAGWFLRMTDQMPGTVNDSILQDIAPNVPHLERLYIAGCVKVTERGVWAVISENTHCLLALGMEGLSPAFVRKSPVRLGYIA